MLCLISCQNHPDLGYRGGQDSIVHLEAELHEVIAWAEGSGQYWAFSLSNASAYYAEFRCNQNDLNQINWAAVVATDWRSPAIREGKQAEFLVQGFFPWSLITRIGVCSVDIGTRVGMVLPQATHRPRVEIKPDWYY